MTAVDVSGLRAGQRVRVTYEGVVSSSGGPGKWTIPDPSGCTAVVLDDGHITSVEVLSEPAPAWLSTPGEAVRETRTGLVWVCDADKWRRAIAAGLVVHLVPEGTP